MDIVEFLPTVSSQENYKVVDIYVNGQNLIDRLHQIEVPLAYEEGAPEMAGAYEGLPPLIVFPPSRHFYGEAEKAYTHQQKTTLLEYAFSSVPGDWPFVALIKVDKNTVCWSDFEQIRRNKLKNGYLWTYEALGKFTFDREQYENALQNGKLRAYS